MFFDIPESVRAKHFDEADETGIAPEVADWHWYHHHVPEVVGDLWETDEEACADLVRIFFEGES